MLTHEPVTMKDNWLRSIMRLASVALSLPAWLLLFRGPRVSLLGGRLFGNSFYADLDSIILTACLVLSPASFVLALMCNRSTTKLSTKIFWALWTLAPTLYMIALLLFGFLLRAAWGP